MLEGNGKACLLQLLDDVHIDAELVAGKGFVGQVGHAVVGVQAFQHQPGQPAQEPQKVQHLFGQQAVTAHAGVYFDVDGQRFTLAHRCLRQRFGLGSAVDRRSQVPMRDALRLGGQCIAQDEDRGSDAGLAQL